MAMSPNPLDGITVLTPLNWTAGPFLTLYVGLVIAVVIVVMALRRTIGPTRRREADGLGVLDLAYLAGGPARAADTALLGLLSAGVATVDASGRRAVIGSEAIPLPSEIEPFRHCASGVTTRQRFRSATKGQMAVVRDPLIRLGLVPGTLDIWLVQLCSLILLAIPITLGVAKIAVGSARHRPVGFLVILVLATAIITLILLCRPPHRTRAGSSAYNEARREYVRAARAPLADELPLAFALGGAAVLSGTDYATVMQPPRSSGGDGSGCSGGGSCGGGGGCGGCGGGGD